MLLAGLVWFGFHSHSVGNGLFLGTAMSRTTLKNPLILPLQCTMPDLVWMLILLHSDTCQGALATRNL